jgi:hypothetical protein
MDVEASAWTMNPSAPRARTWAPCSASLTAIPGRAVGQAGRSMWLAQKVLPRSPRTPGLSWPVTTIQSKFGWRDSFELEPRLFVALSDLLGRTLWQIVS